MKEEDSVNDICQLGTFSYYKKEVKDHQFKQMCNFYKGQGYELMEECVSKGRLDILEAAKIISNRGKIYTLEQFLNSLDSSGVIIK